MLIDQSLVFDMGAYNAQTGLTGAQQLGGGTSTNIIDLVNQRDIGAGGAGDDANLTVEIEVTTGYVGGTSLNVQIQGSQSSGSGYVTYAETGAIPIANLTAGAKFKLKMPVVNPDGGPLPRYLQLAYVAVGTFTAGSVLAWLGTVDDQRSYPSGFTVAN